MKTCVGWLLDLYVEDDRIVIWIKTQKGKVLKFIDGYNPYLYVLPKTEYGGTELFRILSQQTDIATKVSWDYKLTNLFGHYDNDTNKKKLIFVAVDSERNYKHLLRMLEKDSRVKQLFNTDLLDVQKYLFTKLQIEPTSKVEIEHDGLRLSKISKINDDDREISPPPFQYFMLILRREGNLLSWCASWPHCHTSGSGQRRPVVVPEVLKVSLLRMRGFSVWGIEADNFSHVTHIL